MEAAAKHDLAAEHARGDGKSFSTERCSTRRVEQLCVEKELPSPSCNACKPCRRHGVEAWQDAVVAGTKTHVVEQ